jgi:hypothetical protein
MRQLRVPRRVHGSVRDWKRVAHHCVAKPANRLISGLWTSGLATCGCDRCAGQWRSKNLPCTAVRPHRGLHWGRLQRGVHSSKHNHGEDYSARIDESSQPWKGVIASAMSWITREAFGSRFLEATFCVVGHPEVIVAKGAPSHYWRLPWDRRLHGSVRDWKRVAHHCFAKPANRLISGLWDNRKNPNLDEAGRPYRFKPGKSGNRREDQRLELQGSNQNHCCCNAFWTARTARSMSESSEVSSCERYEARNFTRRLRPSFSIAAPFSVASINNARRSC